MERDAEGEFSFLRPNGRELPAVAPVPSVPEDPVAELERDHRELGIDHWRPTPDWDGVEMDLDWALFCLRRPGGGTEAEGEGGSAEPDEGSGADDHLPR